MIWCHARGSLLIALKLNAGGEGVLRGHTRQLEDAALRIQASECVGSVKWGAKGKRQMGRKGGFEGTGLLCASKLSVFGAWRLCVTVRREARGGLLFNSEVSGEVLDFLALKIVFERQKLQYWTGNRTVPWEYKTVPYRTETKKNRTVPYRNKKKPYRTVPKRFTKNPYRTEKTVYYPTFDTASIEVIGTQW
jgi:hypothetical protein